jgi:hypothetical protein
MTWFFPAARPIGHGAGSGGVDRNRGVLRDQLLGGWAGTLCQPPGQALIYG